MSTGPVVWYLRSIGDHDTHRGALRPADGTVIAACGVTFGPKVLPLGRGLGFTSTPPDPDQICPTCAKATRVSQAHPGEPEWALCKVHISIHESVG